MSDHLTRNPKKMFWYKLIFNGGPYKPSGSSVLFVIGSILLFHLSLMTSADELQVSTSGSDVSLSTPDNPADSTAQESSIRQYRKVRDNILRYGAIYRGNSSIRSTRAFTRRPKSSRKDKHRHSTKVDTTKLPIVLLPPVLTFRSNEKPQTEKQDQFVINVVSPVPLPTTIPNLVTNSFNTELIDNANNPNLEGTNRPFVDDKIMAMKNFGVRMHGGQRGEVKFQSTTHSSRSGGSAFPTLNDYTPPPTFFPSAQKYRQVGRLTQRRRNRVRTTTLPPIVETEEFTDQTLSRENQYESNSSPRSQGSLTTPFEQNGFDSSYSKSSFDSSISTRNDQETTTLSSISDFTNSSLDDVVNYDIQRTSPRTVYSLDATGPISSIGGTQSPHQNPPNDDARSEANTEEANYEGSDFLSDRPVSSPGSPTASLDDFYSNVQVSSSLVPRMEINVVTSTSQFLDRTTPSSVDDDRLELKDLIYPPLNILAPPFLEDEFHDERGNVILNTTEQSNTSNSEIGFVSTQYPDLPKSTVAESVENNISFVSGEWNVSSPPALESYSNNFDDNSLGTIAPQHKRPTHQRVSEQYRDCENGDCQKNQTLAKPWTKVPVAPSDIKVLSDTEGIALINKMYENLLRVLNGGPDYYDLSDEPQQLLEDPKEPQARRETTTDSSALLVEESGDIRNIRERGRSQNILVPSGQRTSRRKSVHHKEENSELRKAKVGRKATHLCNSKTLSYVADVSSGCKVFYVCTEYGVGEPMLCPNGTLFNQDYLVCDWWYNVECS